MRRICEFSHKKCFGPAALLAGGLHERRTQPRFCDQSRMQNGFLQGASTRRKLLQNGLLQSASTRRKLLQCSEMNMRKALVYLFVRTFSTLFQLLQFHSALFSLDASRCAQHISIRVSRRNQVRLKPESYVLVKQKHFVHRMFAWIPHLCHSRMFGRRKFVPKTNGPNSKRTCVESMFKSSCVKPCLFKIK